MKYGGAMCAAPWEIPLSAETAFSPIPAMIGLAGGGANCLRWPQRITSLKAAPRPGVSLRGILAGLSRHLQISACPCSAVTFIGIILGIVSRCGFGHFESDFHTPLTKRFSKDGDTFGTGNPKRRHRRRGRPFASGEGGFDGDHAGRLGHSRPRRRRRAPGRLS